MSPKTATDSQTIADVWSELYETWTRTLISPWTLADASDRKAPELSALARRAAGFSAWQAVWDYWVDACQRTVLFWDVLRQRSEQYYAEKAKATPHVLSFDAELLLDGRTFEGPADYGLVRIKPPRGAVIEPKKRPFVVLDPRAGHAPGTAGFKADSELGVAMPAGHPCYEQVRQQRRPASPENPLFQLQPQSRSALSRRSTRGAICAIAASNRCSWRSTARRCCKRWRGYARRMRVRDGSLESNQSDSHSSESGSVRFKRKLPKEGCGRR